MPSPNHQYPYKEFLEKLDSYCKGNPKKIFKKKILNVLQDFCMWSGYSLVLIYCSYVLIINNIYYFAYYKIYCLKMVSNYQRLSLGYLHGK